MPFLESFTVDHTRMVAPAVRIAKTIKISYRDTVTVFDLRFYKPNLQCMPERGMHTMEHLFADFMRNYINEGSTKIVDISPMGCRTGFYMTVIGKLNEQHVADAWKASMLDVLKIKDQKEISSINKYQCGAYKMHSLKEAQNIAQYILDNTICFNQSKLLALSKDKLKELMHPI